MHELDLAPAVFHQRGEPASDPEIEPHTRVLGIFGVHVVAFFASDHLEGQLVVVAEKQCPLARRRNLRHLAYDFHDGPPVFAANRHEQPGH